LVNFVPFLEIIYLLRKGGTNPLRPKIEPMAQNLNPALQHLIRDSLSENPSERPEIEIISTLLHSMNTTKRLIFSIFLK
jgi:hypothetical protein